MKESRYIRADEISKKHNISIPSAYRLIKKLNNELSKMEIITYAGRVDRQYFELRMLK